MITREGGHGDLRSRFMISFVQTEKQTTTSIRHCNQMVLFQVATHREKDVIGNLQGYLEEKQPLSGKTTLKNQPLASFSLEATRNIYPITLRKATSGHNFGNYRSQ